MADTEIPVHEGHVYVLEAQVERLTAELAHVTEQADLARQEVDRAAVEAQERIAALTAELAEVRANAAQAHEEMRAALRVQNDLALERLAALASERQRSERLREALGGLVYLLTRTGHTMAPLGDQWAEIDEVTDALRALAASDAPGTPEPEQRSLPCGCVTCACKTEDRCLRCGAREAPACQASRLAGGPRHVSPASPPLEIAAAPDHVPRCDPDVSAPTPGCPGCEWDAAHPAVPAPAANPESEETKSHG